MLRETVRFPALREAAAFLAWAIRATRIAFVTLLEGRLIARIGAIFFTFLFAFGFLAFLFAAAPFAAEPLAGALAFGRCCCCFWLVLTTFFLAGMKMSERGPM